MFSKLCLTSVPLLTRRWIPGLNAEALFAAAINIGTVIFIASQEPYINESDSQMMTLSQALLAIIIACGTGSTEISAGNSAHQAFVIAVVFGLAIPGTIFMAYSVVDPDLSWAKQQCNGCRSLYGQSTMSSNQLRRFGRHSPSTTGVCVCGVCGVWRVACVAIYSVSSDFVVRIYMPSM